MKLKKIASLALAGVMAVSMLAGCAGKGTADNGTSTVVENGSTSAIVTAFNDAKYTDKDVKISFTYSSELESEMKSVLSNKKEDYTLTVDDLTKMNGLTAGNTFMTDDNDSADKKTVTNLYVKKYDSTAQLNEKVLMNQAMVDMKGNFDDLVDSTKTDSTADNDDYYEFTYTGNVAMVSVKAQDGTTYYYVAYSVTQTAAKTTYHV